MNGFFYLCNAYNYAQPALGLQNSINLNQIENTAHTSSNNNAKGLKTKKTIQNMYSIILENHNKY